MHFKSRITRALAGAMLVLFLLPTAPLTAESDRDSLPLQELRTLSEVFSRIKADYVEEVDDRQLLEDAVRGMLQGLDPHSSYLSPEEFRELQEGTTGQFGGLGIEVGTENGFIKVIAPIDDTPAQRAGVEAGDLIIRLDGEPTRGMSLNEAVSRMRGEPGTDIVLTIVREGEDGPFDIRLTRDVIRVTSVRSRMLEPGYGYIRVSQFQSRTGAALQDAVEQLQEEADGLLLGLVLDLRNNPGGVLQAAVAVADTFLSEGQIVYTQGRLDQAQMRFSANGDDMLDGAPMVVLINEGSASGSEIVAGALQDHRRAVIMGSRSFGKGSVQSVLPLQSGAALKLTTARYYTPKGRSIQAEGIVPDIELERLTVRQDDTPRTGVIAERDLGRHLEGEQRRREDESRRQQQALAREDFALFEALNLLKGLNILQGAR
ncbi:MAG: S41 family peptidase [Ectothiorhodospiraceae bacterium]|nr:S41 family peptidase [Ectothiorhodospiraceae bacterium]